MKKILKNDFNRNVLTLLTGASVAQAIPIAISPILTRLYTPADFGVVALFLSIATIFGAIANGKYELAIVLPEKDEEAINIAALSLIIASFLSGLIFLVILFFHSLIVSLLDNDEISMWLYFIPLVVFLSGVFNMLNYLNTRLKNYHHISRANMYKAVVVAVIQIVLGYLKMGAGGLITGQIFSHIAGNTRLLLNVIRDKSLLKSIKGSEMKRLAKEYIDYPKYTMWGSLANNLSQNINNIFISAMYSISTLGFYSLIQRILGIPIRLIGNAIRQVYFQKASIERNEKGHAKDTFNSTLKKLLVISIPSFGGLYLVIEDLISIVFGEDWRIAGEYARILMPLFFLRFVVAPLSITNPLFKKNKFGLVWQIGLLIISVVIFGVTKLLQWDIITFLYVYTYILSAYYIYFFIKIRHHSYGRD
jgi:O-antigen/teichoic acid export membrane protein